MNRKEGLRRPLRRADGRGHQENDGHGGTPLTARRIKALVEFADGQMGSAETVDASGKAVELGVRHPAAP